MPETPKSAEDCNTFEEYLEYESTIPLNVPSNRVFRHIMNFLKTIVDEKLITIPNGLTAEKLSNDIYYAITLTNNITINE